MIKSDFALVAGEVAALWPRQAWPVATLNRGEALFRDVELEQGLTAVRQLAESGREYAPTPGVVYALAIRVPSSRPALPAADLQTPEQLARNRERAADLRRRISELAASKAMNAGGAR